MVDELEENTNGGALFSVGVVSTSGEPEKKFKHTRETGTM